MTRKLNRYLMGSITLFLIATNVTLGQINTGTITGIVEDPSGAGIPHAQLEATNELTGQTRTAASNDVGYYAFTLLPIGRYNITATAKGFKATVRKGLALSAGQTLSLDIKLEVGATTEKVTVSGAPSRLNYTSPEQIETLGSAAVHQLPLANQDWSQLLKLGTGIANAQGAVTMNGLPPAAMNLTVDGTNAEQDPEVPTLGFYGGFNTINNVNTDAISEITITKGIAPASTGASMSGNINIITKSGTNEFHGSAFEYNDNSSLDARNQFVTRKPRNTFNEFGGSLGGPILKNRLFFFGDYEGVRHSTFSLVSDDVPTPEFVKSTLAVAPEYAPIFKAFPAPNQPYSPGAVTGLYEAAASSIHNDSNADARVDYYVNPSNQITLRVTRARPFEFSPRVIAIDGRDYAGHNDGYNAQFTHSSGNWTAATRFGYNRVTENRLDQGFGVGLDQVIFGGFDSVGAENFNILGGIDTWQEDVAITRGKHTLEFGGIVQRNVTGRIDDTTTTFSYSSLNDFLSDVPSQVQVNFPLTQFQLHMFQFGGYVQDGYRITSNFVLHLGMRYDYFTVPKERDGRIFTRDASPLGPGTGPLRPPSEMYQSYWPNFSPRVGFAWSLGQDRKTVVRGGFGMFFSPHTIRGGPIDDVLDSPYVPFRLTLNRSQALAMGLKYPVNKDALEKQLIAAEAPVATTAFDNYFPNPYSMQWTLDVQRSLGRGFVLDTGYVGTRGLHLNLNEQANLPNRLTGITPDPAFGQFRYYQAADQSSYNGWQTSLERRFSNGLELGVNYTWSRSFAYSDGNLDLQTQPQDNNNVRADHSPTTFDVPNYFSADAVYILPFDRWAGTSGRGAKLLVGGWQISTIFTAGSGLVANVTNGNSSYPADRPDLVNGANAYFSNYASTLDYANPAAFALVPIVKASGAQSRPGDLSRDFLRSPGSWDVDLSAAKNFAFTERLNFQLRADLFNAFNHTNLSGLVARIDRSSFGRLTSATARTIQVGARLTF